MFGLLLNDSGDIYLSGGQFARGEGVNRVTQEVESALRLFLGEWFLDINKGVPYIQEIFKRPIDQEKIENILSAKVLEVNSVQTVDTITSAFDQATRLYSARITGTTIYNEPFEANLPEIII